MGKYHTMFDTDEQAVKYAVATLEKLFEWEHCKAHLPEKLLKEAVKNKGITKGVLRAARKQMGIEIGYDKKGEKFWVVK